MYAWGSRGVLGRITFSGNQARYSGGGMYSHYGMPSLDTVIFRDNHALSAGGMRATESACSLTNVVFYGNQAERGGGGIEIAGGAPKLTNVLFASAKVVLNRDSSPAPGSHRTDVVYMFGLGINLF